MERIKRIIVWLLIPAGLIIGAQIPSKLLLAKTKSVGYHLFYYARGQRNPVVTRNNYVVFEFSPNPELTKEKCNPCRLTKKVGCDAGDRLETNLDGFYFCNGKFLGVSQKITPSGIKLTPFVYNGIIPENKFFALGEGSKYSYDSRYFGFIEKEKVEGIAVPLF